MKSKLLFISAAALLAHATVADTTVYGKINATLLKYDQEDLATGETEVDNWQVTSNASRFGFKGTDEITEGLSAVYQIEYQFGIDDGLIDSASDELKPRNIFLGLKGGWGTFQFGHHDTPTKLIVGSKVDMFNDLPLGDTGNMMAGENRFTNSMMYRSPKMAGVKFDVMGAPGEDDGLTADDNSGLADFVSASVSYNLDALTLAFSADSGAKQKIAGSVDNVDSAPADLYRFVARYNAKSFGVAGLYQVAEEDDSDIEEAVMLLSAYYKLDSWKFKAQFVQTDADSNAFNIDYSKTQLIAGVDYKLSKTTKVFAYYSMIDDESNAVEINDALVAGSYEATDSVFGTGIEHKF